MWQCHPTPLDNGAFQPSSVYTAVAYQIGTTVNNQPSYGNSDKHHALLRIQSTISVTVATSLGTTVKKTILMLWQL